MPDNQLFYGDNLDVLRQSLQTESVDLIYLDPPFNSKANYNLLFKSPKGQTSVSQIEAFEDTWHWNEHAEREFHELSTQANTNVAKMMHAFRSFLGLNDMMAYLTMMANRLLELYRVLKPAGSLYLHCDPTASHYLKIVLDSVFGPDNFRNDIVWKRSTPHANTTKKFPLANDNILYYGKSEDAAWLPQYGQYRKEYVKGYYNYHDPDGRLFQPTSLLGHKGVNPVYEWRGHTKPWRYPMERLEDLDNKGLLYWPSKNGVPRFKRYLDEQKGQPIESIWMDIPPVNSQAQERLGYPTQKPLALLERIIQASSKEGDTILDPFCGCGTAVHAAQKLNRRWTGIDITCLAIGLIEKRMKDAFGKDCAFEVHGTPKDLESAKDLAARDKYQFQWWAVTLVDAQPFQGKKKGADTGIDGLKFFYDVTDEEARKIVISVKGGGLKADDVRALNHVREREKADIGLLISLHESTAKMKADAASAGFFEGHKMTCPRLQLLTIEGLFSGAQRAEHPDYVPDLNFKKAKREKGKAGKQAQPEMEFDGDEEDRPD